MSDRFEWSRYLELARELGGRDDEAAKRAAVGRAFYATFHHVVAVIETVSGDHLGHESPHPWVESRRQMHGWTPQQRAILKTYRRLLKARAWADYDSLVVPNLQATVDSAIRDAEEVLSLTAGTTTLGPPTRH